MTDDKYTVGVHLSLFLTGFPCRNGNTAEHSSRKISMTLARYLQLCAEHRAECKLYHRPERKTAYHQGSSHLCLGQHDKFPRTHGACATRYPLPLQQLPGQGSASCYRACQDASVHESANHPWLCTVECFVLKSSPPILSVDSG